MDIRSLRAVALLASLIVAGGCERDPVEAINARQSAVAPKLDALLKAGKVADEHKYFTFDWPKDTTASLDFTSDASNAIMVLRDDLEESEKEATPELRFCRPDDDPLLRARRTVAMGKEGRVLGPTNAEYYEDILKQIERTRYALVVVTNEVRLARESMSESGKFEPGRVKGVALLVDLETQKLVGAFEYEAESGDEIKASEKQVQEKLDHDLANQWGKALSRGTEERFPGAKVPLTFGYGW